MRVIHLPQLRTSAGRSGGVAGGAGRLCHRDGLDLQDDPQALPRMVAERRAGYDVVYAVRQEARKEPPGSGSCSGRSTVC
ncbi:MAG: hypothetical protein R3B90_01470 [Planctomycetaceae bacterium]